MRTLKVKKVSLFMLVHNNAELLAFVEDTLVEGESLNTSPVLKLTDLVKLLSNRLTQLGIISPSVHSTRLKDRILASFPDLRAFKDGRDILLVCNKDVGAALRKAIANDVDDDALVLAQAARIVRREIKTSTIQFSGTFSDDCQVEAVPPALLTLVAMILHGSNITEQSDVTWNQSLLSMCQLLLVNTSRNNSKEVQAIRHSKFGEPPLPVYLGVLLHNKTRKRELVEKLYRLGLSVSYDRVLEISTQMGTKICQCYEHLNTVCPPHLKIGVFTTSAVDNINHQTSSTSAKSSFNGTGISVFQHFENTDQVLESVINSDELQNNDAAQTSQSNKRLPRLPLSYTQIPPPPYQKLSCPVPEVDGPVKSSCLLIPPALQLEYRWLEQMSVVQTETESSDVSWAAFHAGQDDQMNQSTTKSSLMPLFHEDAATVAMMRHSLDVIKKVVALSNPGQTPVITVDQPLFAIVKNIQWKWPDTYGESKIVMLLGGLHIELAVLKSIGNLLESSGWVGTLVHAGVATAGAADSFLKVTHITRTRRAHQVTACALYLCLKETYQEYVQTAETNTDTKSLEDWCRVQQDSYPMFKFWFTVFELELTMIVFVRSIRTGNFQLYIESLTKLVPWFFCLNHHHYARWTSVHLRDMMTLQRLHPDIYAEFLKQNFTVNKTI